MSGVIRTCGLSRSAVFARAAGRYWLTVFPAVARELRRRRELALEIPDPVLRRVALEALECKRCNLEGAGAVELIAGRHSSRALIRALTASQTMCDYLDLLAERPVDDPVANGRQLHQALVVALAGEEGNRHEDYYAYTPHREDGGYLSTLVDDVRDSVAELPSLALVLEALGRAAELIVAYQSFNHGDRLGSHEPFVHWARGQIVAGSGMSWWEAAAGTGSTLLLFVLISSAARPRLTAEQVHCIETAYLPWIGALHTLLDSLVDLDEDSLTGGHRLIGCYSSPEQAAARMSLIAREALARADTLPAGCSHRLLLTAMTGFYLCDARELPSAYSRAVIPALLSTVGRLGGVAMSMMAARHAMRRSPRPTIASRVAAVGLAPLPCVEELALESCASADGACGK